MKKKTTHHDLLTDRFVTAEFGGETFMFLLSTWAANVLSKKYGGFEKIEECLNSDSPNVLDEIFFILATLANGAIQYKMAFGDHHVTPAGVESAPSGTSCHLPQNEGGIRGNNPITLLPDDYFVLRTMPFEIIKSKDVIFECIEKGFERHIESDDGEGKNDNPA